MSDILVITTGGTIDKVYFDALSSFEVGKSVVPDLLRNARATYPFKVLELMRKDSLQLDDADRSAIRQAVEQAGERRFVVTHGTDTMTATAEVLRHVRDRTIVLVGAFVPARFVEGDAAFNLGLAFAAAQIAPPGVYVTMNGTVFPAASVRKDRDIGSFVER